MEWKPKGRPRISAFKEFHLAQGEVIGIFQGDRGKNPALDIVIKYRDRNTRDFVVRTPKHIHWVIDLLLKKEHNKKLTLEFIKYLLDSYDKIKPFRNKREQRECRLHFATKKKLKRFKKLNAYGQYSVEFLATVMELLTMEEKNGYQGAFMFKGVLNALYNKEDIFPIVSSATHNGR